MSLPIQPTFAEIISEVLKSCGLSTDGQDPALVMPMVEARIRQAQSILVSEYPWLSALVEREIDTIQDVQDYDIPDDCDPSRVQAFGLVAASGEVRSLRPGTAMADVPSWSGADPRRYDIIDGVFRIYPAPDPVKYPKLRIRYYQRPVPLVNETDRVAVDATALTMLAEILVRQQLGLSETKGIESVLSRYVETQRHRQSDGSGFVLGGPRSFRGWSWDRSALPSASWRPW